jgi:cysteine desulfurase/selenocysteine lyase
MSKFNKKDFPWFSNNPGLVYFDNGATTLKPYSVIENMSMYYSKLSTNTHSKDSEFTKLTDDVCENTRKMIASMLGVSSKEISFSSGATNSLNLFINSISRNLQDGDEVIVSVADHTSVLIPWFEVLKTKKIKINYIVDFETRLKSSDYTKLINERTKAITVIAGSNLLGFVSDFNQICYDVKKINPNIFTIIDATQYFPSIRKTINSDVVDYLCASAHKMIGPTGLGFSYISNRVESLTIPILFGGGMNKRVDFDTYEPLPAPYKYEAGTPNIGAIFGFNKSLEYLSKIDFNSQLNFEKSLVSKLISELKKIDGIFIPNENPDIGIVSFMIEGVNSQELASYLGRRGIICRSGTSCVKLISKKVGHNDFVRLSLYFYNDLEDVDLFLKVIKSYKKGDEIIDVIG